MMNRGLLATSDAPNEVRRYRWLLGALLLLPGVAIADAAEDAVWLSGLKASYFGDRAIVESDEIIQLEAPDRAQFAAIVPISVRSKIPQTAERYIKTITFLIDMNPAPLAGRFHFMQASGSADLSMRVRINAYGWVRAIAETNDGKLYMSKRFVKGSGGCSAPAGADIEAAMARLGRIKLKTRGVARPGEPVLTQLMISHPNLTGLQMDQLTRLFMPAHFVKQVDVSFNGEPIIVAETDISISENPNFQFYFVPERAGVLRVDVTDSKGLRFAETLAVEPAVALN
ncbi:MAG: quinoprotein dehydrogenase-associated SoxYZ-like carrier [Gammaproteobacteria bacterium]|nr:quinoprotein dehydrogenase-associated SoxYZ-like carrier [Gammaproteobacteria bacterium]